MNLLKSLKNRIFVPSKRSTTMERATVDKQRNIVEIDGKKYQIGGKIQEQTPQEFFWSLLEGYETRTDFENHPGNIFFLVDGEIVMEFVQENGDLWVHKDRIWRKFNLEFGYNFKEVSELIKGQVEEHFNLKGVKPYGSLGWRSQWWRSISI